MNIHPWDLSCARFSIALDNCDTNGCPNFQSDLQLVVLIRVLHGHIELTEYLMQDHSRERLGVSLSFFFHHRDSIRVLQKSSPGMPVESTLDSTYLMPFGRLERTTHDTTKDMKGHSYQLSRFNIWMLP